VARRRAATDTCADTAADLRELPSLVRSRVANQTDNSSAKQRDLPLVIRRRAAAAEAVNEASGASTSATTEAVS
jgi:hypothetical protein